MAYKIIDIEGIGPVYAEKLIAAGINKNVQLLQAARLWQQRLVSAVT